MGILSLDHETFVLSIIFMNLKSKISNALGNKTEGKYLTSYLAVFASKVTQDDSIACLSSSSVFSISRYPSTVNWSMLPHGFSLSFILLLWVRSQH